MRWGIRCICRMAVVEPGRGRAAAAAQHVQCGITGAGLRDGKFIMWPGRCRGVRRQREVIRGWQVVLVVDTTARPGDLSNDEPLRIGQHPFPEFNGQLPGTMMRWSSTAVL